jgi:hypothetical protein
MAWSIKSEVLQSASIIFYGASNFALYLSYRNSSNLLSYSLLHFLQPCGKHYFQ